jgi:DNA polymerase III subunit epsilon
VDRPLVNDAPVAFVDVETTGCSPGTDRIIDVAVIGARGGELEFEWQSLVNPGVRVPAGITGLTGIDNDMLADAPPFERIARELRARLEGRVFVAHNARFDYGFVRREFARLGDEWSADSLCTVRLSRALYPQLARHNLDALIEFHGIEIAHRHRAMPDAQALWAMWRKLRQEWPEAELQQALDRAAPRIELPGVLPPDLADELPMAPGVYRFFGAAGSGGEELLYIGKANNLRERVLGYFAVTPRDTRSTRIASLVRRVEWTETAGELGALLLEAREIRERQPRYNRQLRGASARFTWLLEGDHVPQLVKLDANVLRAGNAFGTYRSERDARRALNEMARSRQWCLKVLGLETGEGSCVGFQLGHCRGACVGTEPRARHLARVKLGLMRLHLPAWPHDGAVVVREGWGERAELHVLDAWQHCATVRAQECDLPLAELAHGPRIQRREFDLDSFRILTRLLRDSRYQARPLRDG